MTRDWWLWTYRIPRRFFARLPAQPCVFGLQELHYGLGGVTVRVTDPHRLQQTLHALEESLSPADLTAIELYRCLRRLAPSPLRQAA